MRRTIEVFVFIIKCTFIGFGGGNALFPIIKKEAVEHRQWLSKKEFNNLVVATNSIPGPSAVEALSFIAMKQLGKTRGAIVTTIGLLPHILAALLIFILAGWFLPSKYLTVIAATIMPVIAGALIAFGIQYLRESNRTIKRKAVWVLIFLFSLCFTFFVPVPYNAPVVIIIGIITSTYLYGRIKRNGRAKDGRNSR